MKYESNDGSRVETNITGDEGVMGIDPGSMAHIVTVLTDLYSDPAMAAIREYSTNALDANKAAGNTDPINVYLPSQYTPVFEVVDRGVGLSKDEIKRIYTQYGVSTKRDSNDFNGMLGLGTKSALTYTPQFTVVSVKDGVETKVNILRTDKVGVNKFKIVSEREVDEPNGTSIQIPVMDVDSFSDKARAFYRFWEPGTVLVNGEAPDYIFDAEGVLALDADVALVPRSLLGGDNTAQIVQGGVAYPLDYQRSNRVTLPLAYDYTVVARVPIGTLDFAPNREALHYTPRTEDVVDTLAAYVKEATEHRFNERVQAALTPGEAMQAVAEAKKVLSYFKGMWQGKVVPTHLYMGHGHRAAGEADFGMTWGTGEDLHRVTCHSLGSATQLVSLDDRTLLVVGYPNSSVSSVNKAKIGHWTQGPDSPHDHYRKVFLRENASRNVSLWLDGAEGLTIVHWDDIKDVDLPPAVRQSVAPNRSYSRGPSTAAPSDDLSEVRQVDPLTGDYRVVPGDRVQRWLDEGRPVFMIAPSDLKKSEREAVAGRINHVDGLLVVVNKNRHDMANEEFDGRLLGLDDVEGVISQRLREEHDALPLDVLGFLRQFKWSTSYHSGLRSNVRTLVAKVGEHDRFANDHRVRSVQAIADRVEQVAKQRERIAEYLRKVEILHQWQTRTYPVYAVALAKAYREATADGYGYEGPERVDLTDLVNRKIAAFNEQYPLLEACNGREALINEYVRLLDAADA